MLYVKYISVQKKKRQKGRAVLEPDWKMAHGQSEEELSLSFNLNLLVDFWNYPVWVEKLSWQVFRAHVYWMNIETLYFIKSKILLILRYTIISPNTKKNAAD